MLAEGEERRDYYGNEENANQASNDRGEQLCFENVYENFEIFSMYMREWFYWSWLVLVLGKYISRNHRTRRVTFSLPTMVIGDLNNVDLDHCHHDLGDLDQFDFDKWWPW